MGRRHTSHGISKSRVYPVKLAARLAGVSEPTFRNWRRQGLRIISDKRPYLVRGEDLLDFLAKRRASGRNPMKANEYLCMTCGGHREAREGSVTYLPLSALTGRLSASCAECGGKIGRFCKQSDGATLAANRGVGFNATPEA